MRVIGIDPGSRICGWGVIEESAGPRTIRHIDSGAIIVNVKHPLPQRLDQIYHGIREMIRRYQPEEASVEAVFQHKNAKSALVLGHARGVAVLACVHEGLPVYEYAATQIKQFVACFGRAEKIQVALMVKTLLGLPELAMEDAADALAAAICHLSQRKMIEALKRLAPEKAVRR